MGGCVDDGPVDGSISRSVIDRGRLWRVMSTSGEGGFLGGTLLRSGGLVCFWCWCPHSVAFRALPLNPR